MSECQYVREHGGPVFSGYCPNCGWRKRIVVKFAWYDLWIGAFWSSEKRTLYICPLPTLLIEVRFGRHPDD